MSLSSCDNSKDDDDVLWIGRPISFWSSEVTERDSIIDRATVTSFSSVPYSFKDLETNFQQLQNL